MFRFLKHRIGKLSESLYFRFIFTCVAMVVALTGAQLVTDTVGKTKEVSKVYLSEAQLLAHVVARSMESQFSFMQMAEMEAILKPIYDTKDVVRVTLVDKDGTFLIDGDDRTPVMTSIKREGIQFDSINQNKVLTVVSEDRISVSEPLLDGGEAVGSITVEFRLLSYWQTFLSILYDKLFTTIPILMVGIGALVWLVGRITEPMKRLVVAAQSVANGDLDYPMSFGGSGEIKRVGDALKFMATSLKGRLEQVYELAYLDRITNLPNREFFEQELSRAVEMCSRRNCAGAVLFIDLDGFKIVNDRYGHEVGDLVLRDYAQRVAGVLRESSNLNIDASTNISDLVVLEGTQGRDESNKISSFFARLGGDEFTILLPELAKETDAANVAQRVISCCDEPFSIKGREISIGASIGIATFPHESANFRKVLKNSDLAMYQAKQDGKNTYHFYSEELNDRASKRVKIEMQLLEALSNDQFVLHFQPRIDAKDHSVKAVEALLRWNHPERGLLTPQEFLGVAEDSGLIIQIGNWVLEQACRQAKKFEDKGLRIKVAVNIAAMQFEQADFSQLAIEKIKNSLVTPDHLQLEISELFATKESEKALYHVHSLKQAGIGLIIDDFGTGASNISKLARYPYDAVSVDRSFVSGIEDHDKTCRNIIRTIVSMAKNLDYSILAEGVETIDQMNFLKNAGFDMLQGNLFLKPVGEDELFEWLDDRETQGARGAQLQLAEKLASN